jgi:hypothetical protein
VVAVRDDVIMNQLGANPTEEDMIAIVDTCNAMAAGRPIYLMVDLTKVDTLSAAVRRVIGDSAKVTEYRAIAMIGANFQMKVISMHRTARRRSGAKAAAPSFPGPPRVRTVP